jgi:hypothetical protein
LLFTSFCFCLFPTRISSISPKEFNFNHDHQLGLSFQGNGPHAKAYELSRMIRH